MLELPEAKAWLLDRKVIANEVGVGLVEGTRTYLEGLPSRELAEFLIGGFAIPTCPRTIAPTT